MAETADTKIPLTYMGVRCSSDSKKTYHAWLDGTSTVFFDKKPLGASIGSVYEFTGSRGPDGKGLSIHFVGDRAPIFLHVIEDEELRALWALEEANAERRIASVRAAKAVDDPMKEMLLPLRKIIHKRINWTDREGIVQAIAAELRRPLTKKEEES